MFVIPAFAQAGGGAGGFDIAAFLPLILIFVVFYFLLIRPQQKKVKQHKEMVSALRRGDRVVTAGGIIGTVSRIVSDSEVVVEIAEGVKARVMRNTITDVMAKTGAADEGGAEKTRDEGGKGRGKGGRRSSGQG